MADTYTVPLDTFSVI